MFLNGLGSGASEVESVFLGFSSGRVSNCTSEEVFVLLFWEVDVILSVRMRVLSWQPSVILIVGI